MSAALRIAGKSTETGCSRRGATVRSRHMRSAAGSPESAISTALRANVSASPSSNIAAARVPRLVVPRGFPLGLPDCPFWNGRPRGRPAVFAVFCSEISAIAPAIFRLSRANPPWLGRHRNRKYNTIIAISPSLFWLQGDRRTYRAGNHRLAQLCAVLGFGQPSGMDIGRRKRTCPSRRVPGQSLPDPPRLRSKGKACV